LLKWVAYNLAFAAVFPFLLPGFLARMLKRGGYRARMGDRFAIYPGEIVERFKAGDFVWVHAVSVGEVQVAGRLMREWRKAEPGVRFCFSTTSSTGWKTAEKEVGENDVLVYNPLDFPTFVTAALRTVRPRAAILTESEIWPVFIRSAAKRGIPVFLVNARVSDRSAPRYAKGRFLFKDVFGVMTRIFAQSELDRERLLAAGAPSDRIEVTGSFKFDAAARNPDKETELREWIGVGDRRILLGGSTWPGEDRVLLDIYAKMSDKAVLVIAPRHFEKADAVEANIRSAGFECVRRSRGERGGLADGGKSPVFLADTTGELMGLYGIADWVFVGKSLCEHGSQNMIEPCLCGKPTVVGPYTENFRPVMSDLLEADGIVQVGDADELGKTILGWVADGDGGLGDRAAKAVSRRRGVVEKCLESIRSGLGPRKDSASSMSAPLRSIVGWTVFAVAATVVAVFLEMDMKRSLRGDGRIFRDGPSAEETAALTRAERTEQMKSSMPKLKAIRVAGAFIAMMERPDALRVYLADSEAENYRDIFERAGLSCLSKATESDSGREYDIVFAGRRPGDLDWSELSAKANSRGVIACALDVRDMTAGRFRDVLSSFPSADPHFWMIGDGDWLLTGRRNPGQKLKMSALLDFFTQSDRLITVEAEESGCGSVQELFANYVGTRDDVMPAFSAQGSDLNVVVRPEFFVSKDVPDIKWVIPDDMDADIVDSLAEEIRKKMVVRRKVVEGGIKASERKIDDAIACWRAAYTSSPHDTMLLDRLYQLVVNARAFKNFGKIAEAAQCYDIYFAIRPSDLRVADEYAILLDALGRKEESAKVSEYVNSTRRAQRRAEAERIEKAREEAEKWKESHR